MILYILRGAFLLLTVSVAALYVLSAQWGLGADTASVAIMLGIAVGIAGAVVAVDSSLQHKRLSSVSGIFLGLIAGLLAAYALSFVVDLIGVLFSSSFSDAPSAAGEYSPRQAFLNILQGIKVFIGLVTCYVGISLVLQTKDDFRFVIPYVEFAKEVRGSRPMLLDTSVIIDGRILEIVHTRIVQGVLIIPKFVLNELQMVADSADKLRRARGRRGLEILQKLQENPFAAVSITDSEAEGTTVDQKLVSLAQTMQARVMTNDFNLNKIATLRGVEVINLNDLAKALRPTVLPGEPMRVKVIKPGEGAGQGVGYLEDGTMVVVENAKHQLGQDIELIVTSTLQTSAGRMIFGRSIGTVETPSHASESPAPAPGTPGSGEGPAPADGSSEHGTPPGDTGHRPPYRSPYGRNPRRH